jgi:transcriptional regulator with XRE-family HTH domain
MKMLLDKDRLITERQQRAWSQTQLAEVSGLSLRTIQRIEKNGKASLESAKALASVYYLKIPDLRIINSDEVILSENIQPIVVHFCFLSLSAKILATTVFILSTLVFLFMLWTNIPPAWINELRGTVFSHQLSASILNIISTGLTILFTLTIAIFTGILFDALRNEGLYHYMKIRLGSGDFSIVRYYQKVKQSVREYGRFLVKPLMISGVIVLVSGAGVYMTMEDYQKKAMGRFIEHLLADHKTEIS